MRDLAPVSGVREADGFAHERKVLGVPQSHMLEYLRDGPCAPFVVHVELSRTQAVDGLDCPVAQRSDAFPKTLQVGIGEHAEESTDALPDSAMTPRLWNTCLMSMLRALAALALLVAGGCAAQRTVRVDDGTGRNGVYRSTIDSAKDVAAQANGKRAADDSAALDVR